MLLNIPFHKETALLPAVDIDMLLLATNALDLTLKRKSGVVGISDIKRFNLDSKTSLGTEHNI